MTADPNRPREPARTFARLEYDFRRPTVGRLKHRMWNPDDPRLLTPKAFGWGLDANLYWLAHPGRWLRGRRSSAVGDHR